VLLQSASKPHIVITRHESTNIPKAVGLLLPISDVKEIDNTTIYLIDEEGQQLKEDDHPLLYCLLLKRYSIDNLRTVVRLFGANASKAPYYVETGFGVKSVHGYTAADDETLRSLHIVCALYNSAENAKEIIDLLIKSGIDDLNATTDATDLNALHLLCQFYPYEEEFKDLIEFLIERGVDLTAKKKNGWNALHLLCRYNCVNRPNFFEIMKLLIDCGIDPREEAAGWNVLHIVCQNYHGDDLEDVVDFLIEKGVSGMTKDGMGALSIVCSCYSGNQLKQIIAMLIEKGVSRVDEACGKLGSNALHRICLSYTGEHLNEIVSYLCDQGLDVNSLTTNGDSALSILCLYYKGTDLKLVITTLIDRGINVRFYNENLVLKGNLIAYVLAYNNARSDLRDIVDLLFDNGAYTSSDLNSIVPACLYYRGSDLLEIVRRIVTASLENDKLENKERLVVSFKRALYVLYYVNNQDERNKDVIKYLRESFKQIVRKTNNID